jgi:hypothetical protein
MSDQERLELPAAPIDAPAEEDPAEEQDAAVPSKQRAKAAAVVV